MYKSRYLKLKNLLAADNFTPETADWDRKLMMKSLSRTYFFAYGWKKEDSSARC
jgi:hypothetical protein